MDQKKAMRGVEEMKFNYLLASFGVILALILPIAGFFFNEETMVGERPCIDFGRSKNMEGIMCEDISVTVFGIKESVYIPLCLGLSAIGLIIFFIGVFRGEND